MCLGLWSGRRGRGRGVGGYFDGREGRRVVCGEKVGVWRLCEEGRYVFVCIGLRWGVWGLV